MRWFLNSRLFSGLLVIAIIIVLWLGFIAVGFDGDYPWTDNYVVGVYECQDALGNTVVCQATPESPMINEAALTG